MCMFCAGVPIAAATGTALDNKQRKNVQAKGSVPKRIRPYKLFTILVIILLLAGSVIIHTRFGWFWL